MPYPRAIEVHLDVVCAGKRGDGKNILLRDDGAVERVFDLDDFRRCEVHVGGDDHIFFDVGKGEVVPYSEIKGKMN